MQHGADAPPTPGWNPEVTRGRLVEVSSGAGSAPLTISFALVRQVQQQGEPVAWISGRAEPFYPPDAMASGVRLDLLPVILLQQSRPSLRAACHLLRSEGFGAVVVDLGKIDIAPPQALMSRLSRLAQVHRATVLMLTEKSAEAPSLSSLVGLRIGTRLQADTHGRFAVHLRALKDKSRSPGWVHTMIAHGPPGLR